jgi:eukaryotic-like serine/threonine-protein kinase
VNTQAGGTRADDLPTYIGRYRVVERIGKGAMGMVFAAEDEMLGRRVAVKVMMGDLEEEPEMRGRFFREAKITGQLAHRNIVTVFDLGEDDHRPFIVMELLTGLPLGQYLQTPPAEPLDAKIDLMMQVCDGLQVAHGKGVVHRDIKPSNLFVQHDGSVKILDFGVARLASSNLTRSGFLVGTPEYMSPEQAQGKHVDARSDVFSAAGVFYFMLAGRGPFSSPDLPKMLRAVIHDDPPPLTDAEAPDALRRVLMKGLAKNPGERYQQCAEFLAELARVRRSYEGATQRVAQAALERYRQVIATIEERRALGRSLGRIDIDTAGADAIARLSARFPELARHADPMVLMAPMDRAVAQDTLAALQTRHNAELASLEALRAEAADVLARAAAPAAAGTLEAAGAGTADGTSPSSLKEKAAALWRRLGGT